MNRDELIESQLNVAYAVAHEVKRTLPAHVELDELMGDALHGLVVAAGAFEQERGLAFHTYARWRIRGFIIDGLRRRDVVSRRKNWDPNDPRLRSAVRLDSPVDNAGPGASLQDVIADPQDAMEELENADFVDWLLDRLPPRERGIVEAIVWDDVSERDLARNRGVTPGRISQIYNESLHLMRLELIDSGMGGARALAMVRARVRRRRRLTPRESRILSALVGA